MAEVTWTFLLMAPDIPSAHALVGLLTADGVTSRVVADPLLGEGQSCRVFVNSTQLHRANWLLEQGRFTDHELTLLAMGQPLPEEPE